MEYYEKKERRKLWEKQKSKTVRLILHRCEPRKTQLG